MAFLDNSGDIILDAVLTDTGRYRLAQGDGSFKIAKFAVADDEINYASFNNTHASGSAYYDLEILQTPVLEGFTDNGAMMKSKLLSISQNNILYMPILMINNKFHNDTKQNATTAGMYLITVDETTEVYKSDDETKSISTEELGVLHGFNPANGSYIRVDQGLSTSELTPTNSLSAAQKETQYIVEIDNRLGSIYSIESGLQSPSFIDDDDIASYYFSLNNDDLVSDNGETEKAEDSQVITGPRGTVIQFRIKASIELQTSTFLFTKLGDATAYKTGTGSSCPNAFLYIDTMVRVIGATTGYRLDVPVRFIKRDTSVTNCP